MDHRRSGASLAGPAAVAVLAVVLLVVAVAPGSVPTYARVVLLVDCLVASVAALVLMRDDHPGARLAAMAVAVSSVAGGFLVGLVGLPGGIPAAFGGTEWMVIGLGTATVVLLRLAARACPGDDGVRPPYAL